MKICFVVDLPGPAARGGAELQCYLIAKALAAKGWKIAYITNTSFGIEPQFQVHLMSTRPENLVSRCLSALVLFRKLKKVNPDIVLATYYGAFTSLVALYCKFLRKKFVYRAGSSRVTDLSMLKRNRNTDERFLEHFLFQFAPRSADVIITNAHYLAAEFRRSLPNKNIVVIPNGLLIEKARSCRPSHVLWIGRMENPKNPMLFVRLAKELPNLAFVMFGQGPLYNKVIQSASHVPNLIFIEGSDEEKKKELLMTAYALVNVSSYEGFPNTLIEAGIYRSPYISFVDPDEVICSHMLGFHVRSFSDLVEKTATLSKDMKLRRRLGRNIRSYVEANHKLQDTISGYEQLFRNLSGHPAS